MDGICEDSVASTVVADVQLHHQNLFIYSKMAYYSLSSVVTSTHESDKSEM